MPAPEKYDALATHYDRRWQRYHAETLSRAARHVRNGSAMAILDVPCGTGELIRWLLPQVPDARIMGIDGSPAMLDVARRKWADQPRVSFQQAPAEALPCADATFDWVVCCNSLHYFRQPERALKEFARVLKLTGHLFLLDWCRNPWHCRLLNWWKTRTDPAHVRIYTIEELAGLLRSTGWVAPQVERFRVSWIGRLRLWEMMEAVVARR